MRVAIDARELCGRPTGVGRYLAGLLTAWANSAAICRPLIALPVFIAGLKTGCKRKLGAAACRLVLCICLHNYKQ